MPGTRRFKALGILATALLSVSAPAGRAGAQEIPPIENLHGQFGDTSTDIDLDWHVPQFQPEEGIEYRYEYRYSPNYITDIGWETSMPVEGPDVSMDVVHPNPEIGVDLHLSVMSYNEGGGVIHSDRAHLRAWLMIGVNGFVNVTMGCMWPIKGQTISFTVKDETGQIVVDGMEDRTDSSGMAEYVTDDLTDDPTHKLYTFIASWDGGSITLSQGFVVMVPGVEDTFQKNISDGSCASEAPEDWPYDGCSYDAMRQDIVFTIHVPEGAVDSTVTTNLDLVMDPPPPGGMNPGVPGAMVAFNLETSSGVDLNKPVVIGVTYPEEYLMEYGGLGESSLRAYRYVDAEASWTLLEEMTSIERVGHTVTFATSRLGLLAVAAEADEDLDGLGDVQEAEWGANPSLADSDGDGISDGDEGWFTLGSPVDARKRKGEDQHAIGEVGLPYTYYFVAGRILSDTGRSALSNCAYIGPPLDVEYESAWEGPGVENGGIAWGDFDDDGDSDLAICGVSDEGPITKTYENTSDILVLRQSLIGIQSTGSNCLAWGDYDGDGDLDLAMAGGTGTERVARVYENDGGGNLTWDELQPLIPVGGASLAWADYDADGDTDLLVAGHDGTEAVTILYRNDPEGNLSPDAGQSLRGLSSGSVDWADWDDDGDPDLLLTGTDGTQKWTIFYKNEPTGTLTDDGNHGLPAVYLADAEWADFDLDEDLDLAFTGEASASERLARIYENVGGALTLAADLLDIYRSACTWGDIDLDGDQDVAFSGYDGSGLHTVVYENTGAGFSPFDFEFPSVWKGTLSFIDLDLDGGLDCLVTGADWWRKHAVLYRNLGIPNLVDDVDFEDSPYDTRGNRLLLSGTPNPFGLQTTIHYSVPRPGHVSLSIFDVGGRRVRTLVGEARPAGEHSASWDGLDEAGHRVKPGAYYCRLSVRERAASGKLLSIR